MRGIGISLLLIASSSGVASAAMVVPTWGPARVNDGREVLSDRSATTVTVTSKASTGEADPSKSLSVRVPRRGSGTVTRRWTLWGRDPVIAGNTRFPLATGTTRVRFELIERARTWRIYDSDFDNYINVCINGGEDTYASGGRLYCEIRYPQRVRVIQKSKVRNLTRPQLVSETELGIINPRCTVGQTRLSPESSSSRALVQTCTDGQTDRGSDYSAVKRRFQVTFRVPTLTGAMRTVLGEVTDARGKGPDWVTTSTTSYCIASTSTYPYEYVAAGTSRTVNSGHYRVSEVCSASGSWTETSREALPPPTVSVTSLRSEYVTYLGTKWLFTGTVTNNYGKTCWVDVYAKSTNGNWYQIGYVSSLGGGSTSNWTDYITWWESDQGTPTGEYEGRPYTLLC